MWHVFAEITPDESEILHFSDEELDKLDPKKYIVIKNARVNNLKNLSVAIPRNSLVVITGVSGSGKSSLAFDTLFAEGQRMYVESLNSYARQFLSRMEKPDVDYIRGVSPAIAIEQKVSVRNPRSTVGTTTEIYEYLKLLFARIGKTYSPVSGTEVKKDTVTDVVNWLKNQPKDTRFQILAPITNLATLQIKSYLETQLQKGFTRLVMDSKVVTIEGVLNDLSSEDIKLHNAYILIDRAVVNHDEAFEFRMGDSVQTAFYEGEGYCVVDFPDLKVSKTFSDKFEVDGILFEEPTVNLFSFNNPYGACKRCEGFGHVLGIDPDKVFPAKNLSVYEGAIAPWKGEKMSQWLQPLLKHGIKFDFPIHRPIADLTPDQMQLLWDGNQYFEGLNAFFSYLESESYKIQYRVMLSRYRGRTVCPDCKGTRLRKDAHYVRVGDKSIADLVLMPIRNVKSYVETLQLTEHEQMVATRLLAEIKARLSYLEKVGLGYLTLNRLTNTLSGGEFQRIKLATSLGSALVGSMYILDEPSIGLHPKDTAKLIEVLLALRDKGNTVIVVEHEEDVMRAADYILDIGPDAGNLGGQLVHCFSPQKLPKKAVYSHTWNYLTGVETIPIPEKKRVTNEYILIEGAQENNLKNIDVKIPLKSLVCISGVSGSGKSSLVKKIIYPALSKIIMGSGEEFTGKYKDIKGDLKSIRQIEFVDQNPIGKSSRSNPVTYIKAFDFIRTIFAETPLSKQRGYKPSHFSLNVPGGRCETCQGEGFITVEMQFMADVRITCESCQGKRFKQEVLEVTYQDKNICQVLDMTVAESLVFFDKIPKIRERLKPLADVGLGYIKLGQSSSTLSGGEAQRIKLASFLAEGRLSNQKGGILFIFDEPTTGLHFHDISKLLVAIQALVDQGNSVIIVEHNIEVLKCADWIIDLGPDGGDMGGEICFMGTPEDMILKDKGHTARHLRAKWTTKTSFG